MYRPGIAGGWFILATILSGDSSIITFVVIVEPSHFTKMLTIDSELIKRVENGDMLVRGSKDDISKGKYEEEWYVTRNLREESQLEVEKSGILNSVTAVPNVKEKIPYDEFIDNDWYIL